MIFSALESLVAVLSARPDNVSNFVEVDAIFGPVMINIGVNKSYADASDVLYKSRF
jgi:hypothetical protein